MSDKLYTYPIDKLLKWILADLEHGKVFGFSKEIFFTPQSNQPYRSKRYGQLLETPIGAAAGPHTQMSQNIILAWLCGARYIELKTVQTLDELEVTKPCIDMTDEGFNCEWSQELKVHESLNEYLNAWIIIHLLKHKFGWDANEAGFIFNISVGYNLEGIKRPNIQWFLDKMDNCEEELNEKVELLSSIYPAIKEIKIPKRMSDNVTLSTMHGCPPDEIESIVNYLLTDRKLHTAVKLNPTLLGKDKVREILNDKLGYEITVPDEAFAHDLKWHDAVPMIERLSDTAKNCGLQFGLKLTNTLESLNIERFLPESEKMVYMSGRALHPISINLAAKMQKEFDGRLDISFSAGVDAFNAADTLKCNLRPITVCSDLLKPGGYGRLKQYLDQLDKSFDSENAESIDEFVINNSGVNDLASAAASNLNDYAKEVLKDKRYKCSSFKYESIKTNRDLTVFDCIHAPCTETCAIGQDVPEYMYHTSKGNFEKAFEAILRTNPLPNITGMVCDHLCQSKCTRLNYDSPLLIREIKRFVSEKVSADFSLKPKEKLGVRTAVIGAGPAGLSAAYFLALEGVDVSVYETKPFAGGMASDAIPVFRITRETINRDVENIKSLGVNFYFNHEIDSAKYEKIKNECDFIFISIGAQKGKRLGIEGEDLPGVFDQLTFLADVLHGEIPPVGKRAAIIGGGLSAVDAARTAKRLTGESGNVTVIYRRTKNEMPCGWEEVEIMEEEGIEIIELLAPERISFQEVKLTLECSKMKLGEKDSSGRRRPVKIPGSKKSLEFDSIITAIGQNIALDFLGGANLDVDAATNETQFENIFAGGDVIRGADSLINAIADGQKTANEILKRVRRKLKLEVQPAEKLSESEFHQKLSRRNFGIEIPSIPVEQRSSFDLVHPLLTNEQAKAEAERCLYCNDLCNICVTVCPNIANIAVKTEPFEIKIPGSNETFRIEQTTQIINIGDFCNECGNCETFCPTSGAPYKTKPKVYLSKKGFEDDDNCYYFDGVTLVKKEGVEIVSELNAEDRIIEKIFNRWTQFCD